MNREPKTAIGLMSGTSLDGIDAAVIVTDGTDILDLGPTLAIEYPPETRRLLQDALTEAVEWGDETAMPDTIRQAERAMTLAHAEAVDLLVSVNNLPPVDIVGFHGQTVLHQPHRRRTIQIGDGALLAEETGIDVVCDFRSADVKAGGEGAPLAPLYHQALSRRIAGNGPVVVLNLGGVGNVTYIGEDGLLAFDTGPANAPINDWIERHTGEMLDIDGMHASNGTVSNDILKRMLQTNWFGMQPPKSLDRNDFDYRAVEGLSLEDGAATLTAFSAAAVAMAEVHFPDEPQKWVVCGGGRLNPTLMRELSERCCGDVVPVEAVGWRGDFIEAEAFGYLAVRSLYGLPLSLPQTTNVPEPMTGGVLFRTRNAATSGI